MSRAKRSLLTYPSSVCPSTLVDTSSHCATTWTALPCAALGSAVEFSDGTMRSSAKRERPLLILDAEGHPTHLIARACSLVDTSQTKAAPADECGCGSTILNDTWWRLRRNAMQWSCCQRTKSKNVIRRVRVHGVETQLHCACIIRPLLARPRSSTVGWAGQIEHASC
jgi:hypothetical protein